MPLGQIFVKGKIGEKIQKGIDMLTDTATGGSKDSDADIGEIDSININSADSHTSSEEFKMDKSKYYDCYPEKGNSTDTNIYGYKSDSEKISNYVNYLNRNYLTDFTPEEIVEIMSMDYDDAMEYIDESILDVAYQKAECYSSNYGIEITDEFVELLQLPNAEGTEEFMNYMDCHFSEFKDGYIDYWKNLKLGTDEDPNAGANFMKFTDKQLQRLESCNSYSEIYNYMEDITMEASLRPIYEEKALSTAIADIDKTCHALTGYSASDVYSGVAQKALNEELSEAEKNNTTPTTSVMAVGSAIGATGEITRKLEYCQQMVERINERYEYVINSMMLEASSKLDDVELYGNLGSTDNIKFYYKGHPVTNYNPETGEVTYRNSSDSWSGETTELIAKEVNPMPGAASFWISEDWEMVGNFGRGDEVISITNNWDEMTSMVTHDGQINRYDHKFDVSAIFNLYTDCKDSSNYKDQLFRLFVDDSFFHLYTDENVTLVFPSMTETERKIYALKCSQSGEEGEKYLDELTSGQEFRDRVATKFFIDYVAKENGGAKEVDFSNLVRLSEEEVNKLSAENSEITIIGYTDEDGNPQYFKGKEDTMYILYDVNGNLVYYELQVDDSWGNSAGKWAKMATEKLLLGVSNRLTGCAMGIHALGSDEIPDVNYSIQELIQMKTTQLYSMYKGGKRVCAVSEAVGGAIPQMLMSRIPYIGVALSAAFTAVSHYGTSRDQTIKQGYTLEEANRYAGGAAVLYTLEDVITKGIPGFSQGVPGLDKLNYLAQNNYLVALGQSFVGGSTRYSLDKVLRAGLLDESFSENWSFEEMVDQGLTSAMVTGVLRMPGLIKRQVVDRFDAMGDKETLRDKYGLSDEQITRVRRLQFLDKLSDADAVGVASLMDEQLENGQYVSRKEAISMQAMINNGAFARQDAINIFNIAKTRNCSIQHAGLINQCQQQGYVIDDAVNEQIMKLSRYEANMLCHVKKFNVDLDVTKFGDADYIRDMLSLGDTAVRTDFAAVRAWIKTGEYSSEEADEFFGKLIGENFKDFIKNDDVKAALYHNLYMSAKAAKMPMESIYKDMNLLNRMMSYYSDATGEKLNNIHFMSDDKDVAAGKPRHFDTYRTHGIVHVLDVYGMSLQTYGAFTEAGVKNLDFQTLMLSAVMHDTGMSGDMQIVKGANNRIEWQPLKDENNNVGSAGNWRSQHSVNSGRIIMANADTLRGYGYSDQQIAEAALLAFAHSKSNSGLTSLSGTGTNWSYAINALKAAQDTMIKEGTWNSDFDLIEALKPVLEPDSDTGSVITGQDSVTIGAGKKATSYDIDLYNLNGDWQKRMAYQALIVRIGDSLTNNDNGVTNQYGQVVRINSDDVAATKGKMTQTMSAGNISGIEDIVFTSKGDELEALGRIEAKDIRFNVGLKTFSDNQVYFVGENNQSYGIRVVPASVDSNGTVLEPPTVEVVVSVRDPNAVPFATLFAANERLGELNSKGSGIFSVDDGMRIKMVVELQGSSTTVSSDVQKLYTSWADSRTTAGTKIDVRYSDGTTVEK